jgi:hypothetical protein
MRKIRLFTALISLALFVYSNYAYSQPLNDTTNVSTSISDTARITGEVGKIYTKAEADSLYGPVLKADTIKTEALIKLAEKTQKYIMFNLIEGKAYILNSARVAISDTTLAVKPDQQFRLLSTSKVLELIKQGGSDVTTMEIRAKTITLTNGVIVLEQTIPCPPFCP